MYALDLDVRPTTVLALLWQCAFISVGPGARDKGSARMFERPLRGHSLVCVVSPRNKSAINRGSNRMATSCVAGT